MVLELGAMPAVDRRLSAVKLTTKNGKKKKKKRIGENQPL